MADANPTEWHVVVAIGGAGLLLLVITVFVGLARRLRQPAVIGEMAAGIVLGPSVLGLVGGDLPDVLFPPAVRPYLTVVAQIGVLLFMFVIGWEFDRSMVAAHRNRAVLIWVGSLALPMTLGMGLALLLYRHTDLVGRDGVPAVGFALYLGVAMSVTAFPVLARIIVDHGLQSRSLGVLALALAAADDVFAWCVLAVSVALVTVSGLGGYLSVVAWSAVYLACMVWVVRPVAAIAARRLSASAAPYLTVALAGGVFASAFATSAIGIHAIFGAFCFGLVMPRGSDGAVLRQAVEPIRQVGLVLMPVFFVVTGLSVDLTTFTGSTLLLTGVIIAVACLGKLGGVALPARLSGMSARDATALGLLMNTRGLTELVILSVGFSLGLLSVQLYSAMVVMALFTTAMAAPLLALTLREGAARSVSPPPEPADTDLAGLSARTE
ncbi:cation:proton antiporter [Micromonospora sp. WMMD735]|uniref:cation:proton antiporter domain-containing protein n=1 Tax=Micromonospora sp. WMMD735 TaxID=3404130 RepID=UPI003B93BABF